MVIYNYARFDPRLYDRSGPGGPRVGDRLPDPDLFTLEGARTRLSAAFGRILVLETGSLTCPLYVGRIAAMNRLARAYPEATFRVLYVREAHPGSRTPPHRSLEEKLERARRLLKLEPEEGRTILVDDVDGTLHRALGALPNMVYVLDPEGRVLFRADWNDPQAVEEVLRRLQAGDPVDNVQPRFRPVPPWILLRVLRRGGPDAVGDFLRHLPALAIGRLRRRS